MSDVGRYMLLGFVASVFVFMIGFFVGVTIDRYWETHK